MFRTVDIDPARFAPSCEAGLARALAGEPPSIRDSLRGVLDLCELRTRVPIAAYDCERLADQVLIRTGSAGETYDEPGRKSVHLEGRPVLCDRDGPFGSLIGDAERARPTTATQRALAAMYLPAGLAAAAVDDLLDRVCEAVVGQCGGHCAGRLVVG